jgi:glycerate 2-kinase
MHFQPQQFITNSLRDFPHAEHIYQVLAAALNSADAEASVRRKVFLHAGQLVIDCNIYDLHLYKHIYVIGAGKAVVPMAKAIHEILGDRITSGVVITKNGYIFPTRSQLEKQIKIIQANHPIPDRHNLDASNDLFPILHSLKSEDLVICLISGGGSALLLKPSHGISLKNLQDTTTLLLKSGATIDEMNTIRKHLDDFKGGNLAKLCSPASVICLILSDVVGDKLDMVASGPTVADPSTYQDAWSILDHYHLLEQIPDPVRSHLEHGISGKNPETVKPGDPVLAKVHNYMIGNNTQCAHAAMQVAKASGFNTKLLTTSLHGEASQVGQSLAENAKALFGSPSSFSRPFCLLAGGETTVTICGDGMGGRNQELVLGAVKSLSGDDRIILISLATDGGDGPTDAAGAVATNLTYSLGLSKGLIPGDFLRRNDSYHYFEHLGDLLKTGPTLSNVNDLVFIFGQ